MFGALGTILLIVSLVLGGSGVTIVAAQQSLPDDGLYPVKTWSEDVRVQWTENEQTRLQLALEFANRRSVEVQQMLKAGQVPPETVQARWQAELDLAIQLAAEKPNEEAVQALQQVRVQVQVEEQALLQVGSSVSNPQAEAVLERSRTMLQDRLRMCEDGIQAPASLREHLRSRDHQHKQDGPPSSSPAPATQPTRTPHLWQTGTPTIGGGNRHGSGSHETSTIHDQTHPWTTGTPAPGSHDGSGLGDGEHDLDGHGSNPWTEETPTPGSGYGPGPGDGGQDGGSGPGPQPDQPQPGPGGGDQTGDGHGSGTGSGDESGSGSGDMGGDGSGSGGHSGSNTGSGSGSGGGSDGGGGREGH